MTFAEMEMKSLEEMIPDLNIFRSMQNVSFITSADVAAYLDEEYFYNHSGMKVASPIVCRLYATDVSTYVARLAAVIVNRYKPKWEQLFARYSGLLTDNLFDNVGYVKETVYGHKIKSEIDDDLEKKGVETQTDRGSETTTEEYPVNGGRKTTTTVSGSYSDTDTRTQTRTGSQKVTDKGDTSQAVYGFNSSSAVPSSISGPANDTTGLTSETTYGENGLIDANSGSLTRRYGVDEGDTGLVTEVVENGSKTITKSYGQGGKSKELSFTQRKDERDITDETTHSGTDTETYSGHNHKSLTEEMLKLFESAKMFDFLGTIFDDVDEVLTLPVFM